MNKPKPWIMASVLTALVLASASWLFAATTAVDVQLGQSFTGSIGIAGEDTVEAHFIAAEGAALRITVRAARGASLQPYVLVKDASGVPVPGGNIQQLGWLPVANQILHITLPATGAYFVEVGGTTGSGEFWAKLDGTSAEVTSAVLSGTVTDADSGAPIAGAGVYLGESLFATTDASGNYTGELTAGSYTVTFEADGYQSQEQAANLSAGATLTLNAALLPLIPITVEATISGDVSFGSPFSAIANITAPPGTVIESIVWTQEFGTPATIENADSDTATVTPAGLGEYKAELIHHLSEPPIGEDDLPPNVHLPHGEFPGGLQNRWQVVGINPFSLEEAGLGVLKVEVVTDQGTYSDTVEFHLGVPWKVATGLRNVPQGAPVLLQGKEQTGYDWTLIPPPGSEASLMDATTRNPYFTPDIPGLYEVEVTEEALDAPVTLQIFAGTWRGTIVDQDIDGRPVADTACTFCHNGTLAEDKFTDWAQTGHAEIFTNNLNTSTHYGPNCFGCHTVGFDPESDNAGIDEASDYQDFLDAGLLNNPGDNWTTMLADHPDAARKANIQCENCHGPQDSLGHGFGGPQGEPRVDLSSDVCATCHGEPLRHARFQQWQLSAHANYELAIDEGDSGNCSRCHTANGFLTWLPILLDDDPETDPTASITVTWEPDDVHPQTCATCHDPHAAGTTSGINTNATVRISGDTPPLIAGFQVEDVGRGAICMTCHNSRRGLRNDSTFDSFPTSEKARAPHGSAQTDVLVGQNAYLMEVGLPGGHAGIEDTCVVCHMEATPPPDLLAYNGGGTNHTFFADRNICSECHSPYLKASDVQDSIVFLLGQVKGLVEDGILLLIDELTSAGNTIDLDGDATITDADEVAVIEFGETRGRQAITVTFVSGETYGAYRVTDVDVLDGTGTKIGTLYDFADDNLIKAGWNYNLVNNDGSKGVHNPFFASDTLTASRDALVALNPEAMLDSLVGSDVPTIPGIDEGGAPQPKRDGPRLGWERMKRGGK